MRFLGSLLFLAYFTVFMAAPVGTVSAQSVEVESVQYNNKLKVTGVVLPAQHVIVDEYGEITEILSNTEKDVMPKVYRNKLSKLNIINMTNDIYRQYRQIVPEGESKVGVLYKRMPGIYPTIPQTPLINNDDQADQIVSEPIMLSFVNY